MTFDDEDGEGEDVLLVTQGAYEGPLDLLLDLVRSRKVDVTAISILAVIDDFMAWMDKARSLRLELAADWLVMLATLAYIKSRHLVPLPKDAPPDKADALLEDIAHRLRRQESIRSLVEALAQRPRLGANWHPPGAPETRAREPRRIESTLHALLSAYRREALLSLAERPAPVRTPVDLLSVEVALRHLRGLDLSPGLPVPLLHVIPPAAAGEGAVTGRSRIASTYVAALGLARAGRMSVAQADDVQVEITPRAAT